MSEKTDSKKETKKAQLQGDVGKLSHLKELYQKCGCIERKTRFIALIAGAFKSFVRDNYVPLLQMAASNVNEINGLIKDEDHELQLESLVKVAKNSKYKKEYQPFVSKANPIIKKGRHIGIRQRQAFLLGVKAKKIEDSMPAGYDGVLWWKINYPRVKERTAKSKKKCIDSNPFYSSDYGYKMFCRVFPNGYGKERNKSLSVYLVVTTGEFDELLEWPKKIKFTFDLLNQLYPASSFRMSTDEIVVQKPTDKIILNGMPKFRRINIVENKTLGFSVNDNILLRVTVEEINPVNVN